MSRNVDMIESTMYETGRRSTMSSFWVTRALQRSTYDIVCATIVAAKQCVTIISRMRAFQLPNVFKLTTQLISLSQSAKGFPNLIYFIEEEVGLTPTSNMEGIQRSNSTLGVMLGERRPMSAASRPMSAASRPMSAKSNASSTYER